MGKRAVHWGMWEVPECSGVFINDRAGAVMGRQTVLKRKRHLVETAAAENTYLILTMLAIPLQMMRSIQFIRLLISIKLTKCMYCVFFPVKVQFYLMNMYIYIRTWGING